MAKQRIIPIIYKVDYKQVDQSTASVKKAEQETEKFNKQLKNTEPTAQKAFNGIKDAIIASGVIALVGTITKKIFDLGVANEQTAIAFNTLAGSVAKGTQLMRELTKFSIETPFTPEQVNKAAKSLLAFGVEARKVIPTLKLIGDVASGTGKDLSELAVIFGQIRSTGRLMGQDLLQLINAGFNPLQIISEKTGKSVAVLKQEMEKGLITFDMVEQAFKDATSEGGLFFNLMEKQSVSLGGKLSTLQGNFEELGKELFKIGSGPIPFVIDKFNTLTDIVLKFLRETTPEGIAEIGMERFRKKFDEIADKFDSNSKDIIKNAVELQNIFAQDLVNAINDVTAEQLRLDDQFKRGFYSLDQYNLRKEVLNIELTNFRDLLKDTIALKPQEKKTTEAQTKVDKDRAKALAEINKQLGIMTAAQRASRKKPETGDRENTDMPDFSLETEYNSANAMQDLLLASFIVYQNRKTEAAREGAEQRRQIDQAAFDFGIDAIGSLLLASQTSYDEQNAALQARYENELTLAGDNERAKAQIELRRSEEEKKLMAKQIDDEKKQNVRRILIETVLNAVKALGLPPIPGANFIKAGQATAYGLLAAGIARRYSKGSEVGIDGPGTTKSDSIPAMLSRGETVMSYEQTEASRGILKAIKAKKLDDRMIEKLYKKSGKGGDGVAFSDERIVKGLDRLRPDDVIKKGSYLYDIKQKNADNVAFVRRKYIH